jgi:predicted transcriptional regulator
MGYKRMTAEDLYEIFRRYHAGQFKREIARSAEKDRKTVREYLKKLEKMGFDRKKAFPEKDDLYKAIYKVLPKTERGKSVYEELEEHEERFRELINDPREPVKPKTAYEIVKIQGNLNASYSSFKRFASDKKLRAEKKKSCIRIELEPGKETQIDYGKMGLLYDKKSGRNRVVYAYIAKLSCSRLPFIQFVYSQNK